MVEYHLKHPVLRCGVGGIGNCRVRMPVGTATCAKFHPMQPDKNESSRHHAASDRRTGQTNKKELVARRRTAIGSVLDPIRVHLPMLMLHAVLAEIKRLQNEGISCFRRMVDALSLPPLCLPGQVQSPLELLVTLICCG